MEVSKLSSSPDKALACAQESAIDVLKEPSRRDRSLQEDPLLLTQVPQGEPIEIIQSAKPWSYVELPWQPAYTGRAGWHGYRGYVESSQLHPLRQELEPLAMAGSTEQICHHAKAFLGTPYLWGGLSLMGIDCSGLVHLAFRKAGYRIPRDSTDQRRLATPLFPEQLKAGDLLFLGGEKETSHVMLYLGQGRLIEAIAQVGVTREISLKERLGAPLSTLQPGWLLESGKRAYMGRLLFC